VGGISFVRIIMNMQNDITIRYTHMQLSFLVGKALRLHERKFYDKNFRRFVQTLSIIIPVFFFKKNSPVEV
jgi:hypothetical protein